MWAFSYITDNQERGPDYFTQRVYGTAGYRQFRVWVISGLQGDTTAFDYWDARGYRF
jgi:hypothetical protein